MNPSVLGYQHPNANVTWCPILLLGLLDFDGGQQRWMHSISIVVGWMLDLTVIGWK
jgi:hypothetical protein